MESLTRESLKELSLQELTRQQKQCEKWFKLVNKVIQKPKPPVSPLPSKSYVSLIKGIGVADWEKRKVIIQHCILHLFPKKQTLWNCQYFSLVCTDCSTSLFQHVAKNPASWQWGIRLEWSEQNLKFGMRRKIG